MIIITDHKDGEIKVKFPTDLKHNIKGKTIFYGISENGITFSNGVVNKEIICPKYYSRVLIYFDIIIKKKEYNYKLDQIYYNGKKLVDNKFPKMSISLNKEELELEKMLIKNIQSGVLKNIKSEKFDLLLDLFLSNGIK